MIQAQFAVVNRICGCQQENIASAAVASQMSDITRKTSVDSTINPVVGKVVGIEGLADNQFEAVLARLKAAIGASNNTQLATALGITHQAIAAARAKGQVTLAWIAKIASAHRVSADWLLFGVGSMQRRELPDRGMKYNIPDREPLYVRTEPAASYGPVGLDPQAFDLVPMADAELSAGGGSMVISEGTREHYAFRKDWLTRIATSRSAVVLMAVVGDSMSPWIKAGDIVMFDQGRKAVYDGLVYALGQGDLIYIKRLQALPGGRLNILSDNPEVPAYEALVSDIRILGQVIWHAHEMVKRSD